MITSIVKYGLNLPKVLLPVGISVVLGAAFDYLFYGKAPGISFPVYTALILAGLFVVSYYYKITLSRSTFFLVIPLIFFSLTVAVRASGFLVFLNIFASIFILLIMSDVAAAGKKIKEYVIENYFITLFTPLKFIGALRETFSKIIGPQNQSERRQRKISQIIKGVLMAAPLLFVFLLLFSSADLVFYKYLSDLIDIEPETLFRIVIVVFVSAVFIGAFGYAFRTAENSFSAGKAPAETRQAGITEISIFFGLVNLLFFLFILVQLKYLFGGQGNIAALGFTYAEYARKGFFELVMVAIISFLVLWSAEKYVVKKDVDHALQFKILSSLLIVQVIVIMVSAFKRLLLYEGAFGFTVSRFYSHAFIIWLGVIFILLLCKILINQKENILAFSVFLSILVFLASFNIINPDLFIARQNIQHFQNNGNIDAYYLSLLSHDAIPEVVKALDLPLDENTKRELARNLYWKTQAYGEPFFSGWQSTNVSRNRAKNILSSRAGYLEENKDYGAEMGVSGYDNRLNELHGQQETKNTQQ